MIQKKEMPRDIGIPNIPSLEEIQKSTPFLLTLPSMITKNNMGWTMETSHVTTTIVASSLVELKQKSLIKITLVPLKNIQPK